MILTILTLCYLGKTNPPKARRSLIDPTTSSLANWPRNMPQEYQHIEAEIDYKSTIQHFIIFYAEFFLLTNYTNCIVIQYNIDSTLMLYYNLANLAVKLYHTIRITKYNYKIWHETYQDKVKVATIRGICSPFGSRCYCSLHNVCNFKANVW
jgi:hypothetical protein